MRPIVATIGLACIAVGCDPASDLPKPGTKLSSAENNSVKPVDPDTVSATASQPSLMPASSGSTLQVPGFSVSRNLADYVEVLRCAKSFIPFAPGKGDARKLSKSEPTWRDNMRYAFAEAKAANSECKIVGDHIIVDSVLDIAAPSGTYYYIVNPCVIKERTTRANVFCSYDLVFTSEFRYENTLSSAFIEAAAELARAEGALSATFSRLYRHVEAMHQQKNVCDNEFLTASTNNQMFKAVAGIATTGLAVGAGAVMGAGTAMAARQFLGVLQQAVLASPDPQYQCSQFDMEQSAAQNDYSLLESQLRTVVEASRKMGEINSQYSKLDEAILQYVQKPQ